MNIERRRKMESRERRRFGGKEILEYYSTLSRPLSWFCLYLLSRDVSSPSSNTKRLGLQSIENRLSLCTHPTPQQHKNPGGYCILDFICWFRSSEGMWIDIRRIPFSPFLSDVRPSRGPFSFSDVRVPDTFCSFQPFRAVQYYVPLP